MGKRVLGVVRLSNMTDETSSPERQRGKVNGWASLHDGHVVGIAEDLDVSAISKSPWERPALREWLDRPQDYDVIVVWKLDRLARKTKDFLELIEWADAHNIQIVAVDDGIDLTSDVGRMVATILSVFAEWEGRTIKNRAKQTYDHNVKSGKWTGGKIPYGYKTIKTPEGVKLEPHEETAETVRNIVRRMIAGASANSLAKELNQNGTPTPADFERIRKGKESKGARWNSSNLLKLLRSKTLLGQYEMTVEETGEKKAALGDDGLPVKRATTPLISRTEWKQLQEKISKNADRSFSPNRTGPGSPLRGVAYCGVCDMSMYRLTTDRGVLYYRCSSTNKTAESCGNRMLKAEALEGFVEETLMSRVGDLERSVKVTIPGEDHSEELEDVEERLQELREDRKAGLYRGEKGSAEFREMYAKLEEARERLSALPSHPSRVEWHGTGQTVRQYWESLDVEEQNDFLRHVGFNVKVLRHHDLRTEPNQPEHLQRIVFAGVGYVVGDRKVKRGDNPAPLYQATLGDLEELYAKATGKVDAETDAEEWALRQEMEEMGIAKIGGVPIEEIDFQASTEERQRQAAEWRAKNPNPSDPWTNQE